MQYVRLEYRYVHYTKEYKTNINHLDITGG